MKRTALAGGTKPTADHTNNLRNERARRLQTGEQVGKIGGAVRGDYRRWFFFPDATITCGGKMLVRDGKLTIE